MRIGFFTDTFLPQRNGVVASLLSLGPELVKRGHEVSVFCPKTSVKDFKGMTVYSYPGVTFRPYPEFRIALPQRRDEEPELDIVHTHSPFTMGFFGWRVARLQKVPLVSTFHTLLSEYVGYISRLGKVVLRPVTWRFCRLFYNRHRKLITPSETIKRILEDHGIRRPINVIPNGIDTDFLHPLDKNRARRKLGLSGGNIFLSLGRLGYEKNVDVVIRAFENVDARLVVAGRGPAEKKLRKLTRELGLQKKVFFKGFVPEILKPAHYSAADAFVTASTSETQAIVVMEAMACGTPVVGADSLAIPEFVKDGRNGYLFEPGDVGGLSQILQNFKPSKRMRDTAVKSAKNFSIQKCVDKLEKFYDSLD